MNMVEADDLKIRGMAPSDIGPVMALDEKLSGRRSFTSYEELFGYELVGKLNFSFVATVMNRLVGFVIAHTTFLYIPITEVCIINSIVVDPDYRRHHIGSRLIGELVVKCRAEDINIIRALVKEPDESLRLFIEQLGFRKSDIVNYDRIFEVTTEE
jgi:GNAT superfamily N-acetyltransferase